MPRELRPRFELHSDEPAGALLDRFRLRLRASDCQLTGYVEEERVVLCVPPARQRLWSAELRVEVVSRGNATVLEGMYAPHAHVWVTYVIVLAAVVVGITVVLVFALAEWSMNERPVALYGLPPLLLAGALAYAMAFIGQGFATDEVDELRAFLDDALKSDPVLRSHIRNLRPQDEEGGSSLGTG